MKKEQPVPNVSICRPKARSGRQHKHLIAYYEGGERKVESVSTDYEITKRYAMKVSQRLDRQRLGLLTVEDQRQINAAARPITQVKAGAVKSQGHLEDYRDWLIATANTDKQAGEVYSRCAKVIAWCGFTVVSDIIAETVQGAVSDQKGEQDWSNKTANDYLKSMRQFVRWLRRHNRLSANPLEFLKLYPAKGFETYIRRALSIDEVTRLIEWVEKADPYQGISGAHRAKLYFTACYTGLRRSELLSLTPESFDLDGPPPLHTATVTVAAAHSKHRDTDIQPLRRDVAEQLRPWIRKAKPGAPVFRCAAKAAVMLQHDLAGARAAWIQEAKTDQERVKRTGSEFLAYANAKGQVADFHALRHTYGTILAATGANLKTVQELMRHSDIRLTERYVHPQLHDVMRALDGLPPIPGTQQPERQRQRATGTYGAEPLQPLAQRAQFPDVPRGSLRFPVARSGAEQNSSVGDAQAPATPAICDSEGVPKKHRSTEPKVAGSSPASCIETTPGFSRGFFVGGRIPRRWR